MKKFPIDLVKPNQNNHRERKASKINENKNQESSSDAHDKAQMKDRFADKKTPDVWGHVVPIKFKEHNVERHWPNEKPW